MSLLTKVLKQLEHDTMESPNTPNPTRIDVWGENRVLGIVIPTVERKTTSGLVIAETQQSISMSIQIIKISEKVTDEFPKLKAIQEKYDPNKTGELIDGPYVTFSYVGNPGGWPYQSSDGLIEFILIHAQSIRGSYDPRLGTEAYEFDMKEEAA